MKVQLYLDFHPIFWILCCNCCVACTFRVSSNSAPTFWELNSQGFLHITATSSGQAGGRLYRSLRMLWGEVDTDIWMVPPLHLHLQVLQLEVELSRACPLPILGLKLSQCVHSSVLLWVWLISENSWKLERSKGKAILFNLFVGPHTKKKSMVHVEAWGFGFYNYWTGKVTTNQTQWTNAQRFDIGG